MTDTASDRDVRLRAMRTDDASALAGLFDELGYPGIDPADVRSRHAGLAARDDVLLLVAADSGDRPVGFLQAVEKRTLNEPPQASVHSVVVAARLRGTGLGTQLMESAESWARERGLAAVTLASRAHRDAAHRFYERRDYRLSKRSHVYAKAL